MALKGLKVLEIAGMGSAYCGMILAEFGASVVRVDKTQPMPDIDCLSNGKRSVAINFRHPKGVEVFKKMSKSADILLEPLQSGIMEQFGLGPEVLMSDNPRLIYSRMSGFGQKGHYSTKSGHDINFASLSGALSMFGGEAPRPTPPLNVATLAGGGLMTSIGILLALLERKQSGQGQVVDNGMVAGVSYLTSYLLRRPSPLTPLWDNPRGQHVIDGGTHNYTTYETKDGGWMAVGALEPHLYKQLVTVLGLPDLPRLTKNSEDCKKIMAEKFKTKTRQEWTEIFENVDVCVTPVLTPEEAAKHPHNRANNTFVPDVGEVVPAPAPVLSRTPGETCFHLPRPLPGQHTIQVLAEAGYSEAEIAELDSIGAVRKSAFEPLSGAGILWL